MQACILLILLASLTGAALAYIDAAENVMYPQPVKLHKHSLRFCETGKELSRCAEEQASSVCRQILCLIINDDTDNPVCADAKDYDSEGTRCPNTEPGAILSQCRSGKCAVVVDERDVYNENVTRPCTANEEIVHCDPRAISMELQHCKRLACVYVSEYNHYDCLRVPDEEQNWAICDQNPDTGRDISICDEGECKPLDVLVSRIGMCNFAAACETFECHTHSCVEFDVDDNGDVKQMCGKMPDHGLNGSPCRGGSGRCFGGRCIDTQWTRDGDGDEEADAKAASFAAEEALLNDDPYSSLDFISDERHDEA
jgi:hypothetical protein